MYEIVQTKHPAAGLTGCYTGIGIPSWPTLSNIAVMISSDYYKSCIIAFLIILHIIKQIANIYN